MKFMFLKNLYIYGRYYNSTPYWSLMICDVQNMNIYRDINDMIFLYRDI